MQNREFEKNMQQKMEELKFAPSDAVWDKVEASLPEKEKFRRWIFFILFFAVLIIGGSLVWWNKPGKANKKITETPGVANTSVGQKAITQNKENKNKQPVIDTALLKAGVPVTESTAGYINKQETAASVKIKIKSSVTENLNNTDADNNVVVTNQKKLKTPGIVKVKVKAPVQYVINDEKNTEDLPENEETGKIKTISGIDTVAAIVENKTDKTAISSADSSLNKKEHEEIVAVKKEEKKKTNNSSKWQYGIYLASGSSNVTNKLFNSALVFAGLNSAYTSGSPGGSTQQPNPIPNNPSGSLAFSTGFFASKKIAGKWKFSAGINYMYQSNSIKVGSKVDSVVNLNFDPNKSISASNYYRAGNTTSYKNKFHLVEIPVLFQFNFSGRSAFYLETGPTVSYLVSSNALVYNSNSSSYITDAAIFNRLLLSANAGLGVNVLQKSKLPFSIGYQFKYGIVSVVKTSFGKQHFVNSLFFLKVPLKK